MVVVPLMMSKNPEEVARGRTWMQEILSDQGARIATCSDAINSVNEKIDIFNEVSNFGRFWAICIQSIKPP